MSEADELLFRLEVRNYTKAELYTMLDGARDRFAGDDENIRGMVIVAELARRWGKGQSQVKGF